MAPKLPRAVPKTVPMAAGAVVLAVLALWIQEPPRGKPVEPLRGAVAPEHPMRTFAEPKPRAVLPSPTFCDLDATCDGGSCLDGRCGDTRSSACRDDRGCPAGRCLSTGCEAGARECRHDADCRLGMRCDRGWCLEGGRTCATDADCDDAERCAAGRCAAGARVCLRDGDCAHGACDEGACVAAAKVSAPAGCHNDLACANGRCIAGACVPGLRECLDSRDCPGDYPCSDGLCRKSPAPK